MTLGWFGSVRQSNAICDDTTGASESSMVNNTFQTTQENINITLQNTKRNKPLYRVNKSTVTYNNKFYKVTGTEVEENSRKDNKEIEKIPNENKEEDTSQWWISHCYVRTISNLEPYPHWCYSRLMVGHLAVFRSVKVIIASRETWEDAEYRIYKSTELHLYQK